ncbi:unnamed protein product [Urochloa humidicola]
MDMSRQDGCSGSLPLVPAATAALLGHASGTSSGSSSQPAGTTRCRPRTPKRTSFPCMACGRTFPSQQAMAGHCSAHNRTRLAGHQLLPAGGQVVQGFGHHGLQAGAQGSSSATNHTPELVLPYPSFLPFIHPLMSNQMIRGPSCLDMHMHGPSTAMEIWPVVHQIQAPPVPAAQLFRGPVFHSSNTFMSFPCHVTMGVVPGLCSAYSMNQPGAVRADLALQLGSGGGNTAQKRTLLPLLEGGRRSKRAAVVLDGGDEGGREGEHMDDLDLELRL